MRKSAVGRRGQEGRPLPVSEPRRPGPRATAGVGPMTADGGAADEASRRVQGVASRSPPQMPVSTTTDSRGWLMRRGDRLGRSGPAGERDRERTATEEAREDSRGEEGLETAA